MGISFNGALVDFALGAALITLPQYKVPLAAGTAVIALGKRFNKRKSDTYRQRNSTDGSSSDEIELLWSELTCTIVDKKGRSKTLLDGLQGQASSGRCYGPLFFSLQLQSYACYYCKHGFLLSFEAIWVCCLLSATICEALCQCLLSVSTS